MPALVDTITVYAGDTVAWPVFVIKTADNQIRNLVIEGWTDWQAQWRATQASTSEITLIFDGTRLAEGMLQISASAAATRQMAGSGVWDVQATNSNGIVKTWLYGKTKWQQDVTRDE